MPKRSEVKSKIEQLYPSKELSSEHAEVILAFLERIMEPKARPLTDSEVEDHVLVKQVHESKKEEVRNYVRNLDYEWKRSWVNEDDK